MADIFQQYVTNTGIIVPDTADVKEQVQNEFKEALGQDLSLEESTPQGRLIEAETIARKAVLTNNAQVANQLNPNTASGVYLDALCAITGTTRQSATHTEALCTVTGIPGTVIVAGSQAKTEIGDIFEIVSPYTIPSNGTGTTYFQAVEFGPVPCATNTLTQIVTSVPGWETINNPIAAVIGTDVESDSSLRIRRLQQLYRGESLIDAMTSAVSQVSGVLSVFGDDNYTNGTKDIDGVLLSPHSIYIVVDGGADEDIAKAILQHKSLGCDYTGTEEVTLYGKYNQPYTVKFSRPTYKPIQVSVSVNAPSTSSSSDIVTDVKNALAAWANGEIEGVDGLKLGVDVSPFEAAAAITSKIPELFVTSVQVALTTGTLGTDTIDIKVHEKATLAVSDITVTVNS
ncbi:MAG: baseplate J/gp47 family protein [Elusimicrobiaceae bacterium]|nr:baseplate J/gp47 family protein [Elusimicrobiaceae bacterium]MBR4355114.1 baseplate J/gp47 family protein [Elusimicrobiaceae bacterium]